MMKMKRLVDRAGLPWFRHSHRHHPSSDKLECTLNVRDRSDSIDCSAGTSGNGVLFWHVQRFAYGVDLVHVSLIFSFFSPSEPRYRDHAVYKNKKQGLQT